MGTRTSWIAIRGASLEQVARHLDLALAPEGPASPEDLRYQAAALPGGWVVLARAMEADGVVAEGELLKKLSASWRVVGWDAESHVMYSAASEWKGGQEVWAVVHSSEVSVDHVAVRGVPPEGWESARDEMLGKQGAAEKLREEVDYIYDVPTAAVSLVVGYKGALEEDDGLHFVSLVSASSPAPAQPRSPMKSWWKFW